MKLNPLWVANPGFPALVPDNYPLGVPIRGNSEKPPRKKRRLFGRNKSNKKGEQP